MATVEIIRESLPTLDIAIQRANLVDGASAFDGRDGRRLAYFVPIERWAEVGCAPSEKATPEDLAAIAADMREWTAETVAAQITDDVAFAFEKALDQRGLSASCMANVCCMWMRILAITHDGDDYAQYGLPLAKRLAVALGLPNPIGDDTGAESKYAG